MTEKIIQFKIKDYNPLPGYPNAQRVSGFFWECQKCKKRKLDIDLYPKTGLCGSCQFEEWDILRKLEAKPSS